MPFATSLMYFYSYFEKIDLQMTHSAPEFDRLVPLFCNETLNPANTKNLFPDDRCVSLLISLVKIPPVSNLLINFKLPRPLYTSSTIDSICVFVRDNIWTKEERDYDRLADKYLKALAPISQKYGFKFKIITAQQLLTEYKTYEQKRKLACRFNLFLVDTRVNGALITRRAFGKEFRRRGKWPLRFSLSRYAGRKIVLDKFESIILHRSTCQIKGRGATVSVRIGVASDMDTIRANAEAVYEQFESLIPGGGLRNVKSVHLVCNTNKLSMPLYMNTANSNIEFDDVQIEIPPCRRFETFEDECVVTNGAENNEFGKVKFTQPMKFSFKKSDTSGYEKERKLKKWTDLKSVKKAKAKAKNAEIDSDGEE
ncbi:hypothetical protein ACOME3_002910 [Neoechinorhynchus agilis]